MEYVNEFNEQCTEFRNTPEGPIAKARGQWHSVNGVWGDIVDVRHPLTEQELAKYKVTNE